MGEHAAGYRKQVTWKKKNRTVRADSKELAVTSVSK